MSYKIPVWFWVIWLLLFPITWPLTVVTIPIWVPLLIWQSRVADRERKRLQAYGAGAVSADGLWVWDGLRWVARLTPPSPST